MQDTFAGYHPIINFVFFAAVILITMFVVQPVLLVISFFASFCYSIYLNGKRAVKFNLLFLIPLLLIVAITNPLLNHAGVTILGYLPSGNPITLESIIRGLFYALMFVSVLMWFSCFNVIVTSDKIVYLFGRLLPAISLIFSMVLRFVPKFKTQLKVVSDGQKSLGRAMSDGNLVQRAKNGLKILSIMTTWALENGVDTADSMRARGYGLRGRTSFSLFRFDGRDRLLLLALIAIFTVVAAAIFSGTVTIVYFPAFIINEATPVAVIAYLAFGLLCFLPLIIDLAEGLRWRALKSRI